jgi:hypothetical protein
MRTLLVALLCLITVKAFPGFDDYFAFKTLRLDYFRTGNHETEIISIDELIEEPYWGGSKTNLIDVFDYGHHKFEVYDLATETLIYSNTHSSLFSEWQTVAEAKEIWRTFNETITFPFPLQKVFVVFHTRNYANEWEEKFRYTIDPNSIFISRERKAVHPVFEVHLSTDSWQALDVVFLPEGYTAEEMAKFRNDCLRFSEYLLKATPFNEFTDHINIRAVLAPSKESGTDVPGTNTWKQTVMNSNFYTFNLERYLTTMDVKSVRNLAANVPYDQIIILVNSRVYGGGGIYNYYAITTTDHLRSDYVFIHEFGHSFAGLGDEYYASEVTYEDYYNLEVEPWEPNLTTLVDFESKWPDMIDPETPVPTPPTDEYKNTIGVFEGGGYTAKGVYRPFYNCTMKQAGYDAFCPVCIRAIQKKIEFHSN